MLDRLRAIPPGRLLAFTFLAAVFAVMDTGSWWPLAGFGVVIVAVGLRAAAADEGVTLADLPSSARSTSPRPVRRRPRSYRRGGLLSPPIPRGYRRGDDPVIDAALTVTGVAAAIILIITQL